RSQGEPGSAGRPGWPTEGGKTRSSAAMGRWVLLGEVVGGQRSFRGRLKPPETWEKSPGLVWAGPAPAALGALPQPRSGRRTINWEAAG
ncbi:MAG: hypothetical protein RL562_24, partial [Planctomycetota bacterium]